MNKRRFIITVGAVLMVCMLLTGYAAVAAEYGSAEDPLITKSYLDQVLTPSLTAQAQSAAREEAKTYTSLMESKIVALSQALDNKIASLAAKLASNDSFVRKVAEASGNASGSSGTWQTVTVGAGKTLKMNADAELILRSGSAVCVESAGAGLTDLSGGSALVNGGALKANHRYLATSQDAGLTASVESKVLVCGGYTLS